MDVSIGFDFFFEHEVFKNIEWRGRPLRKYMFAPEIKDAFGIEIESEEVLDVKKVLIVHNEHMKKAFKEEWLRIRLKLLVYE